MASKKTKHPSGKAVAETVSEVSEASHPDGVAGALDSLLAAESVWKKPTLAEVVEAHLPTILLLLEKRCPIEKIAASMISGGVKASPATLARLIQGVKTGAKAAPKKAPKKTAPKAKPAPAVLPADKSDLPGDVPPEGRDEVENGKGEVPPDGGDGAENGSDKAPSNDEHKSIGDVAEFLGGAMNE